MQRTINTTTDARNTANRIAGHFAASTALAAAPLLPGQPLTVRALAGVYTRGNADADETARGPRRARRVVA